VSVLESAACAVGSACAITAVASAVACAALSGLDPGVLPGRLAARVLRWRARAPVLIGACVAATALAIVIIW
jgi:hypothetical protein